MGSTSDQPGQSGRRRYREPSPSASRAALVGRHEFHDGGRRDASASRGSWRRRLRLRPIFEKLTQGELGARGALGASVRVRMCEPSVAHERSSTRRTRRSRATPSSSSPMVFGTARSIPSTRRRSTEFARKGVLRQQPFRVSLADDAECSVAIATGHYPGDTGQFANQIFRRHIRCSRRGNFGQRPAPMVPDVEDPFVLADINDHFGGNYLREASIVAFARSYGYNTAALGKTGSDRRPGSIRSSTWPVGRCGCRAPSFSRARPARRAPCRLSRGTSP